MKRLPLILLACVIYLLPISSVQAENFSNFALTTLSNSIGSGDTTLTIASTANFPLTAPFRLVVQDTATSTPEIVYVTGVAGSTYTVTRGYEGTSQTAHSAGAQVAQFVTAGVISNLYSSVSSALQAGNNLSDLANAANARFNLGLVLGTNVEAWSAVLDAVSASQTQNLVLASPSSGSGNMAPRALVGSDLPNPAANSKGGVQSLAATAHQWLNSISTSGVPSASQPAASDISGLAASATTDTTNASNIASGTLANSRLNLASSTRVCPIFANGDSLTAGSGTTTGGYPTVLSNETACPIYNSGIGGQISTQIAQREGGTPFTITVSGNQIASGSNSVTAINGSAPTGCATNCSAFPLSTAAGDGPNSLTGKVCTYHGTLSRVGTSGTPSGFETYTFTPDFTSGGPYSCAAASTFTPDNVLYASYPQLIWAGRNNYSSASQVQTDIASMAATSTSGLFNVLSVLNADYEPAGSANYNTIIGLNAALGTTYGSKYLNVRSYLVSNFNASNLVDAYEHAQAWDIIPYSLHAVYSSGTLSAALNASSCSFSVSNSLTSGGVMLVDGEYILLTTASGSNVTACTRGFAGSTAASHLSGASETESDPIHLNATGYAYVAQYVLNNSAFLDGIATVGTAGAANSLPVLLPPAEQTAGASFGIGQGALASLTSAASYYGDIAIGQNALGSLNSPAGVYDTAVGQSSQEYNINGTFSTSVGFHSLMSGAALSFDTAVGAVACQNLTGSYNACIGSYAGNNLTSGNNNAILGDEANASGGTGASYMTAVGEEALYKNSAYYNTGIGAHAGSSIVGGTNNTVVGNYVASTTLSSGSNNILIGTSSSTDTPASGSSNEINFGGLLFWNSNSLSAPSLPSCGTSPSVDAHANNRSGTITVGSGTVTSCAMTFAGSGYSTWDHCRVTPHGTLSSFGYSYTLTGMTLTGTSLTSAVADYDCDGY